MRFTKIVDAMGVSSREKAELASYQLKEVAQIWYTQWMANRPEEAGPIEWEGFKEAFLGKYFPLEKRECKIEEFINLRQGNMSVEEYALKFSMLSRYAPSLVSNSREEMSRFVTGESDLVKEECRTAMLHGDMNISRLFVYAQSIEESKMTRVRKDLKRGRYRIKDNLGLRRGLQIKIYQVLLRLTTKEVVVLKFLSLLVPLVERSILGSVYPALVVAMVVGNMITR